MTIQDLLITVSSGGAMDDDSLDEAFIEKLLAIFPYWEYAVMGNVKCFKGFC